MEMISIFIISNICVWLLSAQLIPANDINCLKDVKASLNDPYGNLQSWVFDNDNINKTNISIFRGVECWNPIENRVLNINLSGFGLVGKFPSAVSNCTSMTGLDLSNNNLTGSIPSNINHLIPWITTLDLSYNRFSRNITEHIANCTFLNILKLNNNNFTGQIPPQIGQLNRTRIFDVSNNHLSGPVPIFVNKTLIGKDSYANNTGLCGGPLPAC